MRRTCPRDGALLQEQRVGAVNVDVCETCHGTFVDGIELRRVVGDQEIALALAERRGAAPTPLLCSACSERMFLDDVDGIQLDHCTTCLGVWLDAGEVDRLARRSLESFARARAPKLDAVLHDVAVGLRSG